METPDSSSQGEKFSLFWKLTSNHSFKDSSPLDPPILLNFISTIYVQIHSAKVHCKEQTIYLYGSWSN